MEVYKKIEGFENYEVSNFGNVRNKLTSRILKKENVKGYLRVSLCEKNKVKRFLIHRLVSINFLENKDNKPCVNHIDGNKLNNHFSNLEWCTYSENENHSYSILCKVNPIRKLKDNEIKDIRLNCIKGKNQNNKGNVIVFINKYNVDRKTILNVLNKKYYV